MRESFTDSGKEICEKSKMINNDPAMTMRIV